MNPSSSSLLYVCVFTWYTHTRSGKTPPSLWYICDTLFMHDVEEKQVLLVEWIPYIFDTIAHSIVRIVKCVYLYMVETFLKNACGKCINIYFEEETEFTKIGELIEHVSFLQCY